MPPGKTSGLTTNESVENASRAPPTSTHRRVAHAGVGGGAERRQEQVLDQLARHRAAAAVPHHDGRRVAQRRRADPRRPCRWSPAASGVIRHLRQLEPPVQVVRRAGALGRDHRRAQAGCAACTRLPNAAHSCGLIRPCSTSPDRQTADSVGVDVGDREPVLGVEVAVALASSRQPLLGIIADAAPGPVGHLEDVRAASPSRPGCPRPAPRAGRRSPARAGRPPAAAPCAGCPPGCPAARSR